MGLFIGLVALFLFFFSSLFVSMRLYVSLCDIVCLVLLLHFVLGFCLLGFFFSSFSSMPCGWQGLGAPVGCRA